MPFGRAEFLDVFGAYNNALWPAAVALWAATAWLVLSYFGSSRPPNRAISALLAVHWAWAAVAYHAAYFTRINPAAWLFAALFLIQAAIFVWVGVVQGELRFSAGWSRWDGVGTALVAYGLAYPALTLVAGLTFPRMPSFGVPCPTALVTIGLLLMAEQPSWRVAAVPIAWSAVGGSAALLLGMHADLVLAVAGALLVVLLSTRRAVARTPARVRLSSWRAGGRT